MYAHRVTPDIFAKYGMFNDALSASVKVAGYLTLDVEAAEWKLVYLALNAVEGAAQETVLGSHYDEDAGTYVTESAPLSPLEIGLRIAMQSVMRGLRRDLHAAYTGGRSLAPEPLGLDEARGALAVRPTALRMYLPGSEASVIVLRPDVAQKLYALHLVTYPLGLRDRYVESRAKALIEEAREERRSSDFPVPTAAEARAAAEAEWREQGYDSALSTVTQKLSELRA